MTKMAVITGDAPEALLSRMEQDLASAPLPPLEDECIVVQSLGMDRWVRQQFARRQGCAASLAMPFPAAFCRRLASTLQRDTHFATGDGMSIDARFEEQALNWRVFALLGDAHFLAKPAHGPLREFLAGATDAKRFGLARRIAERFDEYRLYRPDLLLTWEADDDPGEPTVHEAWQASLWRTLLNGERPAHFARWFLQTITRLEQITEAPAGLPQRVSVFGVSTLPPLFVRLLCAVARFVPVRFYVLLPQEQGWEAGRPRHPLFETFGGSSRELVQQLLAAAPDAVVEHVATEPQNGDGCSLLQQLQQSVREGEGRPLVLAEDDRSLTVQVCHSPLRELEVLRDQLLDAFAADPSLRPHDVLVMAPDVELYAPMAEAIFGSARARHDEERPRIPYRVADRTLARESEPAVALGALLQLVSSRLGASEVLELLAQPLVRRAAGIAPAQMDQITRWIEDAAIRWGHDARSRAELHGVPAFAENSWRTGLDRLLAGYAAGRTESLVNGVLPLAGDLVGDSDLLGRFVEWVEALVTWLDVLREQRALAAWPATLQQALDWLVLADDADERASVDRVRRDLERLPAHDTDQPVSFEVVREWVSNTLAADEQASGFLTGGLTLCAMKPMRAIPHRIIAMLGLDDRAYPRRLRRPAFDLLGSNPRPGDRDARADDRQLVLDTLMSAGDRLVLSYVGRSQANNSEIAPSVVVAELLDAIDRLCPTTPLPSAQLRVEHPLQPFNPGYFTQAPARDVRLFSFDAPLARSVAGSVERREPPPFLPALPRVPALVRNVQRGGALHGQPLLELTMHDLMDTWLNPAKVHCRRVLQLTVAADDQLIEDVEPMAVDALSRTMLQQRLLDRALEGRSDPARERVLAVAGGELPAAALGVHWHDRLRADIAPLLARVQQPHFLDPFTVEVTGVDWVLRGHLPLQREQEQWRVRAGKLTTRDKARAWVAHVVRCAAAPPIATRIIARDDELVIPPIHDAAQQLDFLVQGVRAVLQVPLPYFLEAACCYRAKARKQDASALAAARAEYHREAGFGRAGGDGCDPYVQLLWRGRDPIEECSAEFMAIADGFWTRFDEVTGS
jgi:exodeoxyribonuclease V gamma subunit